MFHYKTSTIVLFVLIILIGAVMLIPDFKSYIETMLESQSRTEIVVTVILLATIVFLLLKRTEGMTNTPKNCDGEYRVPKQYMYSSVEEDLLRSGLEYDNNLPGYYLINDNKFSEKGIDYDKVGDLIRASKYHDLYNQHNFNIITSPHTHVGKYRGYLNWDKVYD